MHILLLQAAEHEKEAKRLRQEVEAEAREAAKLLPAAGYTRGSSRRSAYDWTIAETDLGFRIYGTLKEHVRLADKQYRETYGYSRINPPDVTRSSVEYMRNRHGILCHGGGGWLILNENQPVSEDEWAAMLAGNIPNDKFWK